MAAPPSALDDLRGAIRLAAEAVEGAADVAEAAHAVIARPWRRSARTRGLTGWIYRVVRRSARLAGALGGRRAARPGAERSARREAAVAALNGVRGDALAASGNPFATPFQLRLSGRALDLSPESLARVEAPSDVLLVLVHGICMHDGQWGAEQAAALAEGLGATEIRARYNSGRHVSQTGRDLADGLEALVTGWPRPVRRVVIVGHSMGGLAARSALHVAGEAGRRWLERDVSLVTLGSPHHGAPLERLGNGVDVALGSARWSRPFARVGQIRSPGVTDLRWGTIRDEDWDDGARFAHGPDLRTPTPLPPGVAVYTVAATTSDRPRPLHDQTVGDGLVPLDSALGLHPTRGLGVHPGRQWVARGMSHFDLTRRAEVTDRMLAWLAEADDDSATASPQ